MRLGSAVDAAMVDLDGTTVDTLGTAPARTLMTGDPLHDALAARAAGCPVALVASGFNHGQAVRSVDADGCIDSIAHLSPK